MFAPPNPSPFVSLIVGFFISIFLNLERDDIGAGKANRNGEAITMEGFRGICSVGALCSCGRSRSG